MVAYCFLSYSWVTFLLKMHLFFLWSLQYNSPVVHIMLQWNLSMYDQNNGIFFFLLSFIEIASLTLYWRFCVSFMDWNLFGVESPHVVDPFVHGSQHVINHNLGPLTCPLAPNWNHSKANGEEASQEVVEAPFLVHSSRYLVRMARRSLGKLLLVFRSKPEAAF